MKKITILLLIIASNSFAQNGWQVVYGGSNIQSPYYTGIHFTDNQTGYLMGNRFYKKTTDGGNSWVRSDSLGSTIYQFLNGQTGWIFGNGGLHSTSNGGNVWNNVNTSLVVNSIYFLNSSTGFSCGNNGSISKTTNGGQNWISFNSGITEKLNSVYFTSVNNGYCAGDWGTILTTTNGGINWIKFTDANLGFFSKIIFLDQNTGLVCGTGSMVFRTTNSGINWQPIYTGFNDNIVSFFFRSQTTGYIYGNFGNSLKTIDGGLSWNPFNNTASLGKVFGITSTPEGTFWCTADTGAVYSSTNEGVNWQLNQKQFITFYDLNSVHFINSVTGWVCGNSGTLLNSTNGGANWHFGNLNSAYNLKSITFLNNTTGYICGGNTGTLGAIYKTTNEGINWNAVYQDSFSLNSIYFLNNNSGWAVGYLGRILKSTNSGLNWSVYRHQFSTTLNDVWFIDENTGFLSRTSLFKSTNGGANWLPILNNVGPNSIQFVNSNTGYFTNAASNCIIYKTVNSGLNWTPSGTGTGSAGSLHFINDQTGWIAGSNIKQTTNGGVNWQMQTTPSNSLTSIYFYNESSGWAVGSGGTILKTGNGGIGITPISTEIPKDFKLHQNYPNPFNPVTKIRFQIPAFAESTRRTVSLKIYDALGREIETLVNENLNPGTYEIEWNASNFSSGVYFYSITSNAFIQTKKMVLLK